MDGRELTSVNSLPSLAETSFLQAFDDYIDQQLQELDYSPQASAPKVDSTNPLLATPRSIRGGQSIKPSPLVTTFSTGFIRQNFFDDRSRWIGALVTTLGTCSVVYFKDEVLSFVLHADLSYGVYYIISTFYNGENCAGEPNSRFPSFGFVYPITERKATDSGSSVFVRATYSTDLQEMRRLWGASNTGFIRSFYRNRDCASVALGRLPFHFEVKPTQICADYTWDIVPVTYYGETFCSNEDQSLTYVDYDSITQPTCEGNGSVIETVPLQCYPLIYIPSVHGTVECITRGS